MSTLQSSLYSCGKPVQYFTQPQKRTPSLLLRHYSKYQNLNSFLAFISFSFQVWNLLRINLKFLLNKSLISFWYAEVNCKLALSLSELSFFFLEWKTPNWPAFEKNRHHISWGSNTDGALESAGAKLPYGTGTLWCKSQDNLRARPETLA